MELALRNAAGRDTTNPEEQKASATNLYDSVNPLMDDS